MGLIEQGQVLRLAPGRDYSQRFDEAIIIAHVPACDDPKSKPILSGRSPLGTLDLVGSFHDDEEYGQCAVFEIKAPQTAKYRPGSWLDCVVARKLSNGQLQKICRFRIEFTED